MFSFKRHGLFISAFVFFAVTFSAGLLIQAAQVTFGYSVIIARPLVATTTTILFSFVNASTLDPGSSLVFSFDPAYTIPSGVTSADGSITVAGIPKTLATSAGVGVYGYAMTGSQIRVTTPSDETVIAGSRIEVLVGRELGFVTPNATGTHRFDTSFYSPSSQLLGNIVALTIIAAPISVTAANSSTNPQVQVSMVKPELRVGAPGTNDDVEYFLTADYGPTFLANNDIPPSGTTNDPRHLFTQPNLETIDESGTSSDIVTMTGLIDANYNIGIKTQQHLTRILYDVLATGASVTQLNFTDPQNGPVDAGQVLLAGDIDNVGTSPSTFGDDTINSADLSILIPRLDDDDMTGNGVRANLNQDIVINSVDLSIMLKNLDMQGDQ